MAGEQVYTAVTRVAPEKRNPDRSSQPFILVRHPLIARCVEIDPSIAFRRFVNASYIRRMLDRQPMHCTWCNGAVVPPKQVWCSAACRDEASIYTDDSVAARIAFRRDRVCVFCSSHASNGQILEVDHILPVARGGGVCGPQGLRTLCHDCHLSLTKELHRQLLDERREALKP